MLIVASSIFLLVTALSFQQRLDDLRIGRTDNRGWITAQLEVDYLKLINSIDAAIVGASDAGDDIIPPPLERNIRREFDVFYSRVTVFVSTVSRLPITPAMQNRLTALQSARETLANTVDSLLLVEAADARGLLSNASELRPLIRDVTVAAVQAVANDDARVSNDEAALFRRFYLQTLMLFVLLAYGSFLVVRLWRQLDARTYAASQTAAIISNAFDATLNAVVVTSNHGELLYFNSIASSMFGLDESQLQNGNSWQLIRFVNELPHDNGDTTQDIELNTLSGKGPQKGFYLPAKGAAVPVELAVVVDTDVSGEVINIHFVRDISVRVNAEQHLRHALHMAETAAETKSMFLATMSHEMRTPLHGLIASLALVDDSKLSPQDRGLIETARSCGARAQMQIDDVLELTRLSQSVEDLKVLPVVDIVSSIVTELRPLANAAGNTITLITKGPFDSRVLKGQILAFSRCIYNLLGNAIKFTNAGLITVRLTLSDQREKDMRLTVEVEDTGVGIAADDLDRIFEYFETIGNVNGSGTVSSGLGLPIVKLAVSQMGGELRVSSMPDIGSRFYFTIPLRLCNELPNTELAMLPAALIGPSAVSKDVLIVDDNEINLTLMCEMVRRMGHHCVLAANGQEAVEKAAATRFDVILMDFSMPVMDGPTAAMHIRNDGGRSADSLIIGVTALIIPNSQQSQLRVFDKVLIKPVGIALLQDAMAQERPEPAAMPEVVGEAPDDDDDLSTAFAAIAALVGEQKARDLLVVGLQDADAAIDAIMTPVLDVTTRADIIHKAVGSTAFLGLTDLSDTLSEAERLARDGKNPAETKLGTTAEHLIAEIREHFATAGIT
ncbi:MAG: response regulator [Loktanella sp.]|nr:response regulator [Loktanella sp.]